MRSRHEHGAMDELDSRLEHQIHATLGAVAVCAATRQAFDRVDYWTRQLDRPTRGAERRYYIYTPRYARADELGESLVPLLGDADIAMASSETEARDTRSALASPEARSAVAVYRACGSLAPAFGNGCRWC